MIGDNSTKNPCKTLPSLYRKRIAGMLKQIAKFTY
jgi:hypothetical protein